RVIPIIEKNQGKIQAKDQGVSIPSVSLFSGKKDSSYSYESEGRLVLLIGLGTDPEYKTIEDSYRRILSKNSSLVEEGVFLDFPETFTAEQTEAALVGFQLGSYSIGFYKKEQPMDYQSLRVEVGSGLHNA